MVSQELSQHVRKIYHNGESTINIDTSKGLRFNNIIFIVKFRFSNTRKRNHKSMINYIMTTRRFHSLQILDVKLLNSPDLGINISINISI